MIIGFTILTFLHFAVVLGFVDLATSLDGFREKEHQSGCDSIQGLQTALVFFLICLQ